MRVEGKQEMSQTW